MTQSSNTFQNDKIIDTANVFNVEDVAQKIDPNKPSIVITGVTGQLGSLMVDYLFSLKIEANIIGGVRRLSIFNHKNISHIKSNEKTNFFLVNFDLNDSFSISRLIEKIRPKYFLNFGGVSYVGASFDFPQQTMETNANAVIGMMEAVRRYAPECRFFSCGSSEEFAGNIVEPYQGPTHPLSARNPYGASKIAARQIIKSYREAYGIFAIQHWLYNCESSRRSDEYVTQKIIKTVSSIRKEIKNGNENFAPLKLGNTQNTRDWFSAKQAIKIIWLSLISERPKEYVIGSGKQYSIEDFLTKAFLKITGLDIIKHGIDYYGRSKYYGILSDRILRLATIDKSLFRKNDLSCNLRADSSEIVKDFGPVESLDVIIDEMIEGQNDYTTLAEQEKAKS
jgi:GDPmannose 4,6-dehydratase